MQDPTGHSVLSPIAPKASETPTGRWAALRAAIRGDQLDYTDGPLPRAIVLLAIPMILEMSMESVFAVVDVFFVMRIGPDAVAVVGVTEAVMTLLYALAIGLSMGTTAVVARRIGEKDAASASTVAVQAIGLGLLVSLGVGLAGSLGAGELLRLMGATSLMIEKGTGYTIVIFAGCVTIFQIHLINAVFRGAGDASMAMKSLWLANLINLVLDPCLIFGLGPFPELGLTGAAVATTIGRGVGVLYQLSSLGRGRSRVIISWRRVRLVPRVMLRLVRVSLFGVLQFLIATASWVGLVRIVAAFGESALAGYTLAVRIVVFAFLPAWGLSNAVASLVGQNLGAGKPGRAERAVWLTGYYNVAFLGATGVLFVALAPSLIVLFTTDPEVTLHGVSCLRIISTGFVFYAFGMVFVQAFNGAGDTVTPTVINFFCFWMLQLPLAWILAHPADWGPHGAFIAIPVAESMMTIVAGVVFCRGRWKATSV